MYDGWGETGDPVLRRTGLPTLELFYSTGGSTYQAAEFLPMDHLFLILITLLLHPLAQNSTDHLIRTNSDLCLYETAHIL